LSSLTHPAPNGERIAVCHDNGLVLSFITGVLRRAGYRVFQAYDGLATYGLAIEIPEIQMLIVNTRLGAMSGLDLIDHVREVRPTVAILHVGTDPEDASHLPPDVPNLAEPFTAEQLLSAVGRLLNDQ
jgi:DNA-binding response OmpR family regulator